MATPGTTLSAPRRQRLRRAGFPALCLMVLAAAAYALYTVVPLGPAPRSIWLGGLAALFVVGFAIESLSESRRFVRARDASADLKADDLTFFAFVFTGAIATYLVQSRLGLDAVNASALAGIMGAVFIKKYAAALYCGSFAGMAAPEIFHLWPCIVVAGLSTGIVFVASQRIFEGIGGKLGTMALIGCLAATAFAPRELLPGDLPEWQIGVWMLIYATLGAWVTFRLHVGFLLGPVLASGSVGLTAGLLLPWLHGAEAGASYAAMVFCASFVGMCGTNRLARAHWIALAGLISGLAFIHTSPYFSGTGGKLGALAFGSVIAVRGILAVAGWLHRGVARA